MSTYRKPPNAKALNAKKAARTRRSPRQIARVKMRFLVGDLTAVRGTLPRLARGYFEGFIGERELRVLVYALRSIGDLYLKERELEIEKRLDEFEQKFGIKGGSA